MDNTIIVALISGGITLIGIILSNKATTDKVTQELNTKVAVIDTKLETIQTDVKEHNHYAKLFSETMPVVQEQVKSLDRRITDLENGK